jgi:hypothetical protein
MTDKLDFGYVEKACIKVVYPPELKIGDHILYGHYEAEVVKIIGLPQAYARIMLLHQPEMKLVNVPRFNSFFVIVDEIVNIRHEVFEPSDME